MTEQLEMKRRELQELQEQVKPSPMRARYEADVARLRAEIHRSSAARTAAEVPHGPEARACVLCAALLCCAVLCSALLCSALLCSAVC